VTRQEKAVKEVPRYEQIVQWLREQVVDGQPGDLLPSEAELAERFNVSRMTARHAVQILANERLVHRKRGSGTFIADQPLFRPAGPQLNFSTDMKRRGKRPSSKLLNAQLREATSEESRDLRIADESHVVVLKRLRLADDIPLAVETTALPPKCAVVLGEDLEGGSLHTALRKHGMLPTYVVSTISAETASEETAQLLQIESEEPVLVERRIILDQNDVPLEKSQSLYSATRYVISATFSLEE